MTTMLRVSPETRDEVQRLAADEYGGVSNDEAVRRLLREHRRARMVARARAHFEDPANVEAYRAEAASLAGADAPISDTWDEPAA